MHCSLRIISLLFLLLLVMGCREKPVPKTQKEEPHTVLKEPISLDSIIKLYKNPSDSYVMVVAHRADWRNFPENSIEAIRSAIKLGVDMVEIDIRKTKDGHLVLMHDETVDRTTSGKGKVTDLTFDEIRDLKLMSGVGVSTDWKVPTLEEALLECKGKIMVNLDKADDYFADIHPVLKKTGTLHQVVLKGHYTAEAFTTKFGDFYDDILYMPLITQKIKNIDEYVASYETLIDPSCYELVFDGDYMESHKYIPELQETGKNIWINTLWASLADGRTDDKAYWNPDENWGWVIDQGATVIQTDRPRELIEYLTLLGKR